MTKAEAIAIVVDCAQRYQEHLVNTNLLIVSQKSINHTVQKHEVLFLPRHFRHLTGVKCSDALSSNAFYQKCLHHRLAESDFMFAQDGTTQQKLSVLPSLMRKNLSVNMIGNLHEHRIYLETDIVAGSIKGCIGFLWDMKLQRYVPNTVLQADIRCLTMQDYARIIAMYQKQATLTNAYQCVYLAKGVSGDNMKAQIGLSEDIQSK